MWPLGCEGWGRGYLLIISNECFDPVQVRFAKMVVKAVKNTHLAIPLTEQSVNTLTYLNLLR